MRKATAQPPPAWPLPRPSTATCSTYGTSGHDFLDELDLANVIEVHIADGSEMGGMYADSHSGVPPEPVWELLDDLVPRAPNLRGITFEFHDSYLPQIGFDGVRHVIERAREAWMCHA